MGKKRWFRIAGRLACLLLMAGATHAVAQSARGSLQVTANLVASTAIVFNADGTAQIITANGPNGLTITPLKLTLVPLQASTPKPATTAATGAPAAPQGQPLDQPGLTIPR